jgi:hypothetical protein
LTQAGEAQALLNVFVGGLGDGECAPGLGVQVPRVLGQVTKQEERKPLRIQAIRDHRAERISRFDQGLGREDALKAARPKLTDGLERVLLRLHRYKRDIRRPVVP